MDCNNILNGYIKTSSDIRMGDIPVTSFPMPSVQTDETFPTADASTGTNEVQELDLVEGEK